MAGHLGQFNNMLLQTNGLQLTQQACMFNITINNNMNVKITSH